MQKTRQPRDASRRNFVRNGFRHALLAGLAVVSLVLFKRSGGKLTGQTCINQGICSGCTAYAACGLPQALSRKQIQSRSSPREKAQISSNKSQSLLTSAAAAKGES